MKNEQNGKLDRLLQQECAHVPDTERAQMGFETRLMAHIREREQLGSENWGDVCWRGVPWVAALALCLCLMYAGFAPDAAVADWLWQQQVDYTFTVETLF